ncbi:MAG: hypothetical protein P8R38_05690, partial [Planctomycetota bacterium]|nr:hypothetical protein [Planctomycetota bacterium]
MTDLTPNKDPRTIWLLATCRFGEAVAVGMLIPSLPLFLGQLTTPGVDRFCQNLAEWLPGFANTFPDLIDPSQELLTALLFSITGLAMAG